MMKLSIEPADDSELEFRVSSERLVHSLGDALETLASVSMELHGCNMSKYAPMSLNVAHAVFDFAQATKNVIPL